MLTIRFKDKRQICMWGGIQVDGLKIAFVSKRINMDLVHSGGDVFEFKFSLAIGLRLCGRAPTASRFQTHHSTCGRRTAVLKPDLAANVMRQCNAPSLRKDGRDQKQRKENQPSR